jgi:predicted thioesterase
MEQTGIQPGLRAGLAHTVGPQDTAAAVGSGDVPVLATPRLLALAEAATVAALAQGPLPPGRTSVGTRVELEHLRPTPVGETVAVAAELVHVDGRLLRFEVVATDDADVVVGRALLTRVVVDKDAFLERVGGGTLS